MVLQLSEIISRAVEQTLEDRVAIAFSGGLDSAIIATIAKKHSQVELISAGVAGSEDIVQAQVVASELGLPLDKVMLDEQSIMDNYGKWYSILKLDLLKLEILVPVYSVALEASRKGHKVLLFGSGAEELFVGYERYFTYRDEGKDLESILKEEYRTLGKRDIGWVQKVCRHLGVEARFPFYDKALFEAASAIPLDERMHERTLKKIVLREAGKMLGVPETALKRKKRAMQYGSGIHKIIMKRADEINRLYPSA